MQSFFNYLYSAKIGAEEDLLRWPLTTSGAFEVKSYYYKALSPTGYYSFPLKPICKAKISRKIAFFTWTTTKWKILTMDNLRKQGLCVVDWCSMCKRSGESADHLVLHCCFAYDIWSMVFGMFGLAWAMPQECSDLPRVLDREVWPSSKCSYLGCYTIMCHDSTYSYMAITTFKWLAPCYTLFNLTLKQNMSCTKQSIKRQRQIISDKS